MPGNIMAQMAMAPERKTNQEASGLSAGVATVIKYAKPAPKAKAKSTGQCQRSIFLLTTQAEASTKPKKKAQSNTAWYCKR